MSGSSIALLPGQWVGDLPDPKRPRWVLRCIALGMALFIVWAANAQIDQVTRAPAQLIAASRTQLVQSADAGVITQLHVSEGDEVKAGQLLVTLEKARAAAAVNDSAGKVAALRITLERLRAEATNRPLVFSSDLRQHTEYIRNQTALYQSRRTAFESDIAAMSNIQALAKRELAINQQLEASGDVSRVEVLRLERALADVSAQLSGRRNKYFQDVQAEMAKAQEDLSTQVEQLRDRTQMLAQTELVAPLDGIINNIRITTVGGVVRASETVMELLPTGGDLIAETKISPADISFIAVDQEANVKVDAYDSSIYGALKGMVSYISPDVVTEETRQGPTTYYRVHVRIVGSEFKGDNAQHIKLRPGLSGSVEIKAQERTVLSYLTKPVTKTLSNAFGER
jgi:membrane fusion protein, adhesin transport system